ncbi:MAG: chromosomal replication initiator protein DnaA [Bacteroidales bacterium]|nr:chromosomal replication initiator protein DnaA [Bacteroidales bacterium]
MNLSSFNTWFTRIVPLKVDNNILTVQVPSAFFYEYLEGNFIDVIRAAIQQQLGKDAKLEYSIVVDSGRPKSTPTHTAFMGNPQQNANYGSMVIPATIKGAQPSSRQGANVQPSSPKMGVMPPQINNPFVIPAIQKQQIDPQLNPNYTLDNFVEGKCNQLGRSAAESIARRPSKNTFNPLMIFGNSGLGKTHLAQSIGNAVREQFPDKVVLYVEANKFQTQYSDACRNNTRNDFIHFYQMLDVLIIDDVQEFAGKTGTQDTFFAIFNSLHQAGKQIILTCDSTPAELKGLADRLLTRFRWGLTVEMASPDYATRLSILQRKCYNDGVEIPLEILQYIAQTVVSNVRELEGALLTLMLHMTVSRDALTLDVAKELLGKIVKGGSEPKYKIDYIMKTVCEFFNIKEAVIHSKSRAKDIVVARQMIMYFSKQLTDMPYQQIGLAVGGRDHSTVLYACKAVQKQIDNDPQFKELASNVENKIKSDFVG